MTAEAFIAHYTAVADASPVPVLLYSFPAAFGLSLPIDAVARLAGHPNVAGLKESSGDIGFIADCVSRTPEGFVVVVGSAPTLYASLCVGAAGGVVVGANVIPELFVELHQAVVRGDHAEALRLQRAITPLGRAVGSQWGIAGLKAAMSLAGYRGGWPRAPLAPAPPAIVEQLRQMLDVLAAVPGLSRSSASRSTTSAG
jgi:4-hydroxy-2-oxoglutarate aldolase